MKLYLKFSKLNGVQRKQIKDVYDKKRRDYPGELFSNPNSLSYFVNPTNGNVIFQKEF